ncbi:thioredoxin family protein [Mangrovibacterium sp.]|uniref:thioredoxin family protein n=1 Tax=Mangrovibacterium sp. TaxID=1961364 RepID=UPI0035699259
MKKMKLILTLLFFAGQLSLVYSQNWELDFDNALKTAQDSNKIIVLVFSGSDWCAPCMKLEKEIWESETFKNYAEDHFVMVRADFPRGKANKLPKEQEEKNAKLAEKYNQNGYFPSVVIIDQNEKVLGNTGYKKLSPEEYIEHINNLAK